MYDEISYSLYTDSTNYNALGFIGGKIPSEVITYKGVELTFEDLDSLVSKKLKTVPAPPKPKERIIFNGDCTIYYDKNGKKTVVHKMPDEEYDREKAVLWALLKSKGVKSKDVIKLMDESVDQQFEKYKKEIKKINKAFKQLTFEDLDLTF